jgi:hypothetical protein
MKIHNDLDKIDILNRVAEMERARYSSSGDYSVTSLIDPPRVVQLKKRHKDIVPPIKSVISAMLGTAVHEYYEKNLTAWAVKHEYDKMVMEQQLKWTFDVEGVGRRSISGRFDLKDGDELWDIKTAKAWKIIFDPTLDDWHAQQNMYAYLCHLSGIDVESINIQALYKDWLESAALRDTRTYPQSQVVHYELDFWPLDETYNYLMERLSLHVAEEETPDDELPMCTRKERWERFMGGHEVEYAIMKSHKAKRAAKVFRNNESMEEIYAVANAMKGITNESFIEVRYATRKRCEGYCAVNKKCNHYLAYIKAKENKSLNDIIPIKP